MIIFIYLRNKCSFKKHYTIKLPLLEYCQVAMHPKISSQFQRSVHLFYIPSMCQYIIKLKVEYQCNSRTEYAAGRKMFIHIYKYERISYISKLNSSWMNYSNQKVCECHSCRFSALMMFLRKHSSRTRRLCTE